jgi:hypothetical protein
MEMEAGRSLAVMFDEWVYVGKALSPETGK